MFRLDGQARVFGVTALENLFITEYLPYADGSQIKVYLSGLYHSGQADGAFGVREMAAELNLEESQVLSALRYWERRRLVERVSDNPPTYVFHHLGQRMLTGQDGMSGDRAYIEFSEAVYAQFGERRKLRPNDVALAFEWVQELGLTQEVVLMLLNHFADTRGVHFSFKSAQTLAVMMKEEGISTPEQAEQYLGHSKKTHAGARAVLSMFNLRRLPTEPELALYRKWTEQWGFDEQGILAACGQTVTASNPSFSYLNGILERLKNKGAGTAPGQVRKQLAEEGEDAAEVKKVLETLGVFSVSAFSVLPAYLALRERFPAGMILLAAKSVRARNGTFEHLEPKLLSWKEMGLDSESRVLKHLKELKAYEPMMFKVFERLQMDGRPGEPDLLRLKAWLDGGQGEELILEAAEQARGARQKLPYMERVLANWKKDGVDTAAKAKARPETAQRKPRKVAFQQYDQGPVGAEENYPGPDLLKEAREMDGQ